MPDAANAFTNGRLHTLPSRLPTMDAELASGTHQLLLPNNWKAQFHIPPNVDGTRPAPLLTVFHGVNGLDGGLVAESFAWADKHGVLVLAQKSIGLSWDIIRGGLGPDVEACNYLLDWVLRRHAVDGDRIGIAGFSDGASYALTLGLMNGDLFHDILAFSPGFMRPISRSGKPRVFISHGASDPILPVECGRRIARQLANEGHELHYQEFEGGHFVPVNMIDKAMNRFLC